MAALCRDCSHQQDAPAPGGRCPRCGSRRLLAHDELFALAIAHLDCDAFYASIEKRDNPALADRPVIVGGGHRGVVATCCYIARLYGVRSAMPMFRALALCPEAVVIRPDMAKYQAVGRQVRALMMEVTPLVQPLSIDEAFLDLTGTERLHGSSPAGTLTRLTRRIEGELGITVSLGLSYNKFLAKTASDLDKPRGFAVIGRADALGFLGPRPVRTIWGVGAALQHRLEADGIRTIGDLRRRDEAALVARYGAIGRRLWRFAHGDDDRAVDPSGDSKSVSAETTFDRDIADPAELLHRLWPLAEAVARRLRKAGKGARGVTIKLRTGGFRTFTRSRRLATPTQRAEPLYREAAAIVTEAASGQAYRLLGLGCHDLVDGAEADPPDLLSRTAAVDTVLDEVRARLGDQAVITGRFFTPKPRRG